MHPTGQLILFGSLCLFSSVRGVALDRGQAVVGARIERSFKWGCNDLEGRDESISDVHGMFVLPAIWRHSLFAFLLPHEPFVRQTILIHHRGTTCKAWMFNKREYEEDGELDGRPISLICQLDELPGHRGEVCGISDLM